MKLPNLFPSTLAISAIATLIISSLPVKANPNNPNGPTNISQQGWSLWQPWENLKDAGLEFGLSNMDLGLGMELQNQCFGEVDTPHTEKRQLETYWYRVSRDVNTIGSGEIEYGCWINGSFKATVTAIAMKISLAENPCYRVNSSAKDGLAIHSDATTKSRLIGRVSNGEIVKPTDVPVIIRTVENLNWIEIESPLKGWISNGSPDGRGNLIFCNR